MMEGLQSLRVVGIIDGESLYAAVREIYRDFPLG